MSRAGMLRQKGERKWTIHHTALSGQNLCEALALTLPLDLRYHERHRLQRKSRELFAKEEHESANRDR
jgi:hypothetical protein